MISKTPTSTLQKALSYIWPIVLEERLEGPTKLKVELYRNQIMLSTPQAIYSWGLHYKPFRVPFKYLRKELPQVKTFLLLGTGLGSALSLLQKKYNCFPEAVLVDHNETILKLAKSYSDIKNKQQIEWICADANTYLVHTKQKFDLIGVDLFTDMHVEQVFKQEAFFKEIANHLNPGGIAIFNNIFSSKNDHDIVLKRMKQVFDSIHPIEKNINTFTIARLKK